MEESIGLLGAVNQTFLAEKADVRAYSPLTLAFIGDTIFDLIIRTLVVEKSNRPAQILHKEAVRFVNAATQARLAELLQNELTDEELAVYKRGRNAKSATTAKNASVQDYRKATGLEALLGYLYLSDRLQRGLSLVKCGMDKLDIHV